MLDFRTSRTSILVVRQVLTLTATGPSVKNKDKQWVGRRLLEAVESTKSLRKQDFGVGVWREGDTGFSPDASTVEVHYHAVIALWEKARTRRFPSQSFPPLQPPLAQPRMLRRRQQPS